MTPRLVPCEPAIRVRLAVEPNAQRTSEWLRELIAKARQWQQKQAREKEAA